MDALADELTSLDIAHWHAYFQASQEIALGAIGGAGDRDRSTDLRGEFNELDEAGLRAFFRGHNQREAAQRG